MNHERTVQDARRRRLSNTLDIEVPEPTMTVNELAEARKLLTALEFRAEIEDSERIRIRARKWRRMLEREERLAATHHRLAA